MKLYMKNDGTKVNAIKLTDKNIHECYSEVNSKPKLNCDMANDKWDEYERFVKEQGLQLALDQPSNRAKIGDYIIKEFTNKLTYEYHAINSIEFETYHKELNDIN